PRGGLPGRGPGRAQTRAPLVLQQLRDPGPAGRPFRPRAAGARGAAEARPGGQARRREKTRDSRGLRPRRLRRVPASQSSERLLPTRAPRPLPRWSVPREVVDETWLTATLGSLVRRRRRNPWCGCCPRAASSPSAILYRFKINSPLTSNTAAALSTSRELAGPPVGPSAAPARISSPSLRPRPAQRSLAPPTPCLPAVPSPPPQASRRTGAGVSRPPPSHTPTSLSSAPHPP
ncbi:hypothetical protein P7K49_028889, partial [Saguinus oedipus]